MYGGQQVQKTSLEKNKRLPVSISQFSKLRISFFMPHNPFFFLFYFLCLCELLLTLPHLFGHGSLWPTIKTQPKPFNLQCYQLSYPLSFHISDESDQFNTDQVKTTAQLAEGSQGGGVIDLKRLSKSSPSAVTFCGQACPKYVYYSDPKLSNCLGSSQNNKNAFITQFTAGFNDSI